jgi:dihydroorotase
MSQTSLLIHNVRLVDPYQNRDEEVHLLVNKGQVEKIIDAKQDFKNLKAENLIDGKNKILMPSLVDTNAHLREPGYERKATLESELIAAAAAGIGHLACLPTCKPCIDSPSLAKSLIEKAKDIGKTRLYPIGALSKSLEGKQLSEMKALSDAGCLALTNYCAPLENLNTLTRCYEYAATFDIPVVIYPQVNELFRSGGVNDGFWSAKLGLPGIPESAETIAIASHLLLIEQSGVRAHFSQLSCKKSVEQIENAKKSGLPISADVAAHQLFLDDTLLEGYDSNYHLIPPIRTLEDQKALIDGIKSGVIDNISSSHQPHEAAAKHLPFQASEPGISALETLLPLSGKLQEQGLTLLEITDALTRKPAKIFGIEQQGIKENSKADFCLIDTQSWKLEESSMLSSGKNSPFIGKTFNWKALATCVDGKLIFENKS